jgi:hypothetical protein
VTEARRGASNSTLAQMFDMTPQRVGQILAKAHEAVEPMSAEEADREIRRALSGLDQVLDDAAEEYRASNHAGYRVGLLKLRVGVLMQRLELQSRANIVPRHLGAPAQAMETVALLDEFAELLKRENASDALVTGLHKIAMKARGGRPRLSAVKGSAA